MKSYKKLGLCFILAMSIAVFTGCQSDEEPQQEEETGVSYDVTLYFANLEYVETGDEDLPMLLTEKATIEVDAGENAYLSLLKALQTPSVEGHSTIITEEIKILDVKRSPENEELLIVDLGGEGLSSGSLGETLLIAQIVETLLHNEELSTQAMPPKKVQFLVDGRNVETIMGHIDATAPFESKL